MKVQVVFFVQGIVPSSFPLWSSFFMREVHDSTFEILWFIWNWFEGVYQLDIYCTRRMGERGKRTPNPQLGVYPLSPSNKRTLLNSNLRVVLVFEYQRTQTYYINAEV